MTTRRNFLKSAGLTIGCLTAGGPTIIATANAYDEKWFPNAETQFPLLNDRGISPVENIAQAVCDAPSFKPTQPVEPVAEGDPLDPTVWAREAHNVLNKSLVFGNLVKRNYRDEVAQYGDVVNIQWPKEFKEVKKDHKVRREHRRGDGLITCMPLKDHFFARFTLPDGMSQRASFEDIMAIYLTPAMVSIARCIDLSLNEAVMYQSSANVVENVLARDLAINARCTLNTLDCEMENRHLLMSPRLETDVLKEPDTACNPDGGIAPWLGFNMHMDSVVDGGIAFHRDAIVLANRPAPLPHEFAGLKAHRETQNDLSLRVTMQYDICAQGTVITFDSLCGAAVFDDNKVVALKKTAPALRVMT
jgi:hypothetical protein